MLDDSRPRSLAARVIHDRIPLVIRYVQLLRLKPDGPVLQMPEAVIKILIDRPRIDDLPELSRILFCKCPIIDSCHYWHTGQELFDHLRISADRDALVAVIEVVVIVGKPKRQPPDDEGRKLRTRTSPLLLCVFSDQFFVDIRPGERNRLLFQILRDKCFFRRKSALFLFCAIYPAFCSSILACTCSGV